MPPIRVEPAPSASVEPPRPLSPHARPVPLPPPGPRFVCPPSSDPTGIQDCRRVFVSSVEGVSCQELAEGVGLFGTFAALEDVDEQIPGPYVLHDGTVIATGWTQLEEGPLDVLPDLDEHGAAVPDGAPVRVDACSAWHVGDAWADVEPFPCDAPARDLCVEYREGVY